MDQASQLEQLQDVLGYRFDEPWLLHRALVHRSYAHENPEPGTGDNETLEFLGDAVLDLAISHLLFELFPDYNEGELSRLRSAIVNERELAKAAALLGLGGCLLLGRGEEMTGGREKPSLLANSLEALLAAVYLDGGLQTAIEVVERLFADYLDPDRTGHPLKALDKDFKTQLQELTQAHYKLTPTYDLDNEEGPDHDKTFHMSVALNGRVLARGSGKSKKEAQQRAARKGMEKLKRAPEGPAVESS